MVNFYRAFPLLLAAGLLAGCCTQKKCSEESYLSIAFDGFDLSDIDTIYTTGYAIGSGFTTETSPTQIDSVVTIPNPGTGYAFARRSAPGASIHTSAITVQSSLPDTHEWKLVIPALNRTILINNYGYATYKCNRCFPVSTRDNKIRSLSTCSVNGAGSSREIRITK